MLIHAADNIFSLIGLSGNLNCHLDLPLLFLPASFCSGTGIWVATLKILIPRKWNGNHITWPQIAHLSILCPHCLGCPTAFMVQKKAYSMSSAGQAQEKFLWTQLLLFKIPSICLKYWRGEEWVDGYRGVGGPIKIPGPQSLYLIFIIRKLGFYLISYKLTVESTPALWGWDLDSQRRCPDDWVSTD